MAIFKLTDAYQDYFKNAAQFNDYQHIGSKKQGSIAYGVGAIRQYINHILDDMLQSNLLQLNGYFLKFGTNNDFLHNTEHMKAFGKLITTSLKVRGTLPFHLNPHILEVILGPMDLPILEYFYDKMYPSMSKMLESNYETTCQEVGYTTSEGYIRSQL